MKTVIISDVDNTLRRQNVETETSRVGLDFTFFDAIMANRMDPDEVASKALPNTFLTRGEIGCALSHLGVMREFCPLKKRAYLSVRMIFILQTNFQKKEFIRSVNLLRPQMSHEW